MQYIKISIICILYTVIYIFSGNVFGKILIIIPAYNCPEFIALQYKTFQKFLKDEYEMVVFNDAANDDMCRQLEAVCADLKISCIRVPQEIHKIPYLPFPEGVSFTAWHNNPSQRNCNVVQYSLDTLGFKHNDIVVLFESDLFLVKEFSIRKYMRNIDLSGFNRAVDYPQPHKKGIKFLWIGLIFLNMPKLPNKTTFNVNCGVINETKVDSGGYTYHYLKNNPTVHLHYFDKLYTERFICKLCENKKSYKCKHNTRILKKMNFDDNTIQFIQSVPIDWGSGIVCVAGRRNVEFFLNNTFVHFYGGSGYAKLSPYHEFYVFHQEKKHAFEVYIKNLLST